MALSVLSDRGTGLLTLREVISSVDGIVDRNLDASALGLGDVMLYSVSFRASGVATLVASPTLIGVRWFVLSGATDSHEFARVQLFPYRVNAVVATQQLRQPVFWRTATEEINCEVQEIDTNATPTMTATFEVTVRRLTETRRYRPRPRKGPIFTIDP